VLEALTVTLVRRAQLGPVAAAVATADARDLPEELRTVRNCSSNNSSGGGRVVVMVVVVGWLVVGWL
jgi:hypothetical protein